MTFKELGLDASLLSAVEAMGFETPSEVQRQAIPVLLGKDGDLVALAQTGTGKTAAFGFPLIQLLKRDNKGIQGLILCPTRELCLQISNELTQYSRFCEDVNISAVYGGASITEQVRALRRGCQILVATPGRLQDMIRRDMVDISTISTCVLDEADEMLNMGFYEDIKQILSHTPKDKNTWLFSATMPKEVAEISRKFMSNPHEITVGTRNQGNANIHHEYYMVAGHRRYQSLKRLVDYHPGIFTVIFCRTKRDTQSVAERLINDGYNAAALHGDLSQNQRDLVMKSFRANQIQMLVATDVAARGIDVDKISHVINYQLPDEIETYVHRSGRTGRAGNTGISMILMTKSEQRKIRQVERVVKKKLELKNLPGGFDICERQLYHLAKGIKDTEVNHEVDEYLPKIYDMLSDLNREDLIKKMVSVEFNRFLNYYKKDEEPLEVSVEEGRGRRSRGLRFFINLGEKDGFDWRKMKDFLKQNLSLERDEIFKVDVIERCSFFNLDADHEDNALSLNGSSYKGREVSVEIANEKDRKHKRKSFKRRF